MPEGSAAPARTVEVPLRRLPRWLDGFAERHGPWQRDPAVDAGPGSWPLRAEDGARALVHVPSWADLGGSADLDAGADLGGSADLGAAALAALRPRFGAVLIRRAGYAVGLFDGAELVERKVGSRHIHGRTAAGGWSQQRYARRRANQADEIVEACAGAAERILTGAAGGPPQFLVTGGDRPLVAAVLAGVSPALAARPVAAHLGIGTPDADVLAGVPDHVLAVRIELRDP